MKVDVANHPVCPDTSPRGVDIEGDSDAYDFGKGAGFYLNATEAKWAGMPASVHGGGPEGDCDESVC